MQLEPPNVHDTTIEGVPDKPGLAAMLLYAPDDTLVNETTLVRFLRTSIAGTVLLIAIAPDVNIVPSFDPGIALVASFPRINAVFVLLLPNTTTLPLVDNPLNNPTCWTVQPPGRDTPLNAGLVAY